MLLPARTGYADRYAVNKDSEDGKHPLDKTKMV
jgi:hypothetical protein